MLISRPRRQYTQLWELIRRFSVYFSCSRSKRCFAARIFTQNYVTNRTDKIRCYHILQILGVNCYLKGVFVEFQGISANYSLFLFPINEKNLILGNKNGIIK